MVGSSVVTPFGRGPEYDGHERESTCVYERIIKPTAAEACERIRKTHGDIPENMLDVKCEAENASSGDISSRGNATQAARPPTLSGYQDCEQVSPAGPEMVTTATQLPYRKGFHYVDIVVRARQPADNGSVEDQT